MVKDYRDGNAQAFNGDLSGYARAVERTAPRADAKAAFEVFFNRFDPFLICQWVFYLGVLLLVFAYWLTDTKPLKSAALALLVATVVLHTAGLLARIYISGRPPVTNLYSSAVFIAWGAVLLCIGLEAIFRKGFGTLAAAVIGFASLQIADALAHRDADTMAQLQAVLDTNFWLATHVVCVTMGYMATYLAGLLAIIYIIRGVFSSSLTKEDSKDNARMAYGILCFAMLFSFVGTILGGIWADQSWGRFWGWDPKENGAVLVVLWNALILHARWGGVVKERGVMVLAVLGNIVTSWSFFGTNMLGIGLHSYGFMGKAFFYLTGWVILQIVLIIAGSFVNPGPSAPVLSASREE